MCATSQDWRKPPFMTKQENSALNNSLNLQSGVSLEKNIFKKRDILATDHSKSLIKSYRESVYPTVSNSRTITISKSIESDDFRDKFGELANSKSIQNMRDELYKK